MRADEFIPAPLDEGLKNTLAAAGLSAAVALGGHSLYKHLSHQPTENPQSAGTVVGAAQERNAPTTLPEILQYAAEDAGIKGSELAQLMAQAAHETLNFTRLEEMGSAKYFKRYDPKHNPRKAKILGNTKAGDGERYKGRGFLQITGRYNYARAGKALGLPLEAKPELLADPQVAAKAAVWFWQHRVQPKVDDFTDVEQSTKPINPGLKGLADRIAKFKHFHGLHGEK